MDEQAALQQIHETLCLIDEYNRRIYGDAPGDPRELNDDIHTALVVVREIAEAMGAGELRPMFGPGSTIARHRWDGARLALVDFQSRLANRELINSIVGLQGPQLSASALHPLIWNAASRLWDDEHHREAVQVAASALESKIQGVLGKSDVSGQDLATAFSIKEPDNRWPRLRFKDIDRAAAEQTWTSAHEGAASLLRGIFLYVRNLASHNGGFQLTDAEALEQLATLSLAARMIDRCELARTS